MVVRPKLMLITGCLLAMFSLVGSPQGAAQQNAKQNAEKNSDRIRRIPSENNKDFPAAIRVHAETFGHTTQILPKNNSETTPSQCQSVLSRLAQILKDVDSDKTHVVQLNAYVTDVKAREVFEAAIRNWFGDTLPAVTWVATPLPVEQAQVGLDAVFISKQSSDQRLLSQKTGTPDENPNGTADSSLLPAGDVVYVSGQAEPGDLVEGTKETLLSLERTLQFLELDKQHVVQIKCFLTPMSDVAIVNQELAKFFGDSAVPPVSHVEWISGSREIEIELVAWAPAAESEKSVSYATPPGMRSSPVYSRLARIHGQDRIYVSGLFAQEVGSGAEQVLNIYQSLESTLKKAGSDLKHLAKATYYVSAADSSSQLNKLRPNYYDPERPPAASKSMMKKMAAEKMTIHIDMIAAPNR
ncbi:RidA family protein [Thalassoglobus polymorphus]|uniref:Endoribonuclease L-PSP n=1 Tax=Thalassoglobus polymorphus TaxID=2527994 RepID=A0A517QM85_9PLAN|nr:Rid family hydrolase [Thalassoglobus polymorphus]QDT32715.1 Endoribonuclease L-PSP [Thalassoglobus polymorphus]